MVSASPPEKAVKDEISDNDDSDDSDAEKQDEMTPEEKNKALMAAIKSNDVQEA